MDASLPISVVIPAYNREVLLARALRSVAQQRPRGPLEVIVVDDCSSDGTAAVAEQHGARVIRHPENRGEGEARNSGIEAASGEWIALLDSDDQWLPDHLERLWAGREGLVLVADSALACGPDPADDRVHGAPGRRPLRLDTPVDLVWPENPVPVSGGMVAVETARAVGGYRPLPHCADLDFLLRCLERGPGLVLPAIGVLYHVHPDQVSSDRETMQSAHARVCEQYAERPWWSPAAIDRWRGLLDWDRFQERRGEAGARAAAGGLVAILTRPRRLAGVLGAWTWRLRLRRRSGRIGRDGEPTLALLADGQPPAAWRASQTLDLRRESRAGALARLLRRPTGAALVGRTPIALAVRALGVRPVFADRSDRPR